jgi:hypothetical protein
MTTKNQKKHDKQKKKPYRNFCRKPEEKGIPMLKYGKANHSSGVGLRSTQV